MTKICRVCGRKLPATAEYFVKRAAARDGISSQCRECCRTQAAQKYRHEHQGSLVECEECGKQFLRFNKRQVYCSRECRLINDKRRQSERDKLRYYAGLPAKHKEQYVTAQPTGLAPGGCRW